MEKIKEKISEIDVLSKSEEAGHLKIYFDNSYKVAFIKNKALTNLQNESLVATNNRFPIILN